jgi:RNA polymerase sigma-70 factor (ECF subfamily)
MDATGATGTAVETAPTAEEQRLVELLRQRDEAAFVQLVDRYGAAMLRVASLYVGSRAVAEEVVQETWLAVLQGIDRFEQRASLKTWLFRILTNRAKTRGVREGRTVPFSALGETSDEEEGSSVDPDRFFDPDHAFAGHWTAYPQRWEGMPERRLLASETQACIAAAIESLPPAQRTVITMRDVEGWSSDEVCNALEISETNQRVLLHRARSKVRQALEDYLAEEPIPGDA